MATTAKLRSPRYLLGMFCLSIASVAQAQALDDRLEKAFASQNATFIGSETVPHQPPNAGPHKYLILDFRFAEPQPETLLQTNIHRICQAVLLDPRLISSLSDDGYNRLAVAFDHKHQYDCF